MTNSIPSYKNLIPKRVDSERQRVSRATMAMKKRTTNLQKQERERKNNMASYKDYMDAFNSQKGSKY